jgi:pimeloyl-ACP methyl ester carboxylesterase
MMSLTTPKSIEPKVWQSRGNTQNLLGHSIFVIDEGPANAPIILLLHGFPTSSWDWNLIWESLKKDYRLIALDMLGFGFSDKPNRRDYSIHQQADIVESLVKKNQLEEFHVLAHDYGDTVAQELLSRQIEKNGAGDWLSCCFLNGGLFPETHRALLTQKLLLSPLGKYLNYLTGFSKFSTNFSSVFGEQSKPSEQDLKDFWQIINFNDGKHLFHNLITYIRDRREHRNRWVSALQESQVPLGVINGSVDPISGSHMVARYRELNCRLDYAADLTDVGHYPQMEDPLAVIEHYKKFLSITG